MRWARRVNLYTQAFTDAKISRATIKVSMADWEYVLEKQKLLTTQANSQAQYCDDIEIAVIDYIRSAAREAVDGYANTWITATHAER